MDFQHILDQIISHLNDERLQVHLLGLLTALTAIVVTTALARAALKLGGDTVARLIGIEWVGELSREVTGQVRALVFWLSLLLVLGAVGGAVAYHYLGQDLRHDLQYLRHQVTPAHLLAGGVVAGKVVVLALGILLSFRLVRRLRFFLEFHARRLLPQRLGRTVRPGVPDEAQRQNETVTRWCHLLERYVLTMVFLAGVWVCDRYVGFAAVDHWVGLLMQVLSILTLARLLTMGCGPLLFYLSALGTHHLSNGPLRRYWERVTRLFPLGERCFEAAVYIRAATLCVRELDFITFVAEYGNPTIRCIAIFFGTRVIIELLYVFLNEAFGVYEDETTAVDQRRLTLVPLLQSVCQYALYTSSGLMMLHEFGIPTSPILAGAGILGLAGGLGAQSLVTDVVSGFFILFENQYLVGDIVQICDALGRVEAVSIRHTQVRDEQGKLYIIPNGQIKTVVNYSKGYVNAVVDVKVSASASLDQMVRDMTEAGRRLRQARREVIGETAVKGLVDLSSSDMVVRAVTKVQPGTHVAMQLEYRRHLKEVFEQTQATKDPALAA